MQHRAADADFEQVERAEESGSRNNSGGHLQMIRQNRA
jgi:hypothetical protein